MKDCSLKICLGCSECKKIVVSHKGWWHPESNEKCFNIEKGINYGPSDNCILKFEHLVLDKRIGFKLNYFEDYIELYEYLRENKISIKNPFGRYFCIINNSSFYEENNYLVFKDFVKNSDIYFEDKETILFDDKNLKFFIKNDVINNKQNNWLNKFLKNRTQEENIPKSEVKHRIVFPVAGVTFEDRQNTIKKLFGVYNSGKRMKVEFVPEPDNVYDKNAIKIYVHNDGEKEFVGYVPKTLNKDQDNESKIEEFNSMINSILDKIESAETSWIGERNGTYGLRVVCYEKNLG